MQELLDFFGHGFCHQIRERSLEAGGVFFSVCARDTGIYLGLVLTTLFICLYYCWHRRHSKGQLLLPSGLAPWWVLLMAVLFVLPMAIDGVSSYAHLRETTNQIRFFSGYSAGMGIGLVAPCAVLGMFKNSSDNVRVLSRPYLLLPVVAASMAVALCFWLLYQYLGLVIPLLMVATFLLIAVMLNALILSMTRRFCLPVEDSRNISGGSKGSSRRRWLTVLALGLLLALLEITLLGLFRDLFFNVLFGGDISSIQEIL